MNRVVTQRSGAVPSDRRAFLRHGTRLAVASAGGFGLLRPARATGSGRALVCVFLYGGNDSHNMLPPTDTVLRGRYDLARGALAIAQSDVVPLAGASVGLHPQLAALKPVWDAGSMAMVHNVGPLTAPLSKAGYTGSLGTSDLAHVPEKLFSHNDQQHQWQNGVGDSLSVRGGWGGRLMEKIGSNPVISFSGGARFSAGAVRNELALPGPGASLALLGRTGPSQADYLSTGYDAMRSAAGGNALLERYVAMQADTLAAVGNYQTLVSTMPPAAGTSGADNAFNGFSGDCDSDIARQLYQVSKFITGGANGAQVYFVSLGGFDHHADQLKKQSALFAQLGPALGAFWNSMVQANRQNDVTVFTASDFGRTLAANASGGTDHAWGSSQLVFGGAVRQGEYGTHPSLVLGGQDDASTATWDRQGRWIPTTSVSQFGATLARWVANDPGIDLSGVFPLLPCFGAAPQFLA